MKPLVKGAGQTAPPRRATWLPPNRSRMRRAAGSPPPPDGRRGPIPIRLYCSCAAREVIRLTARPTGLVGEFASSTSDRVSAEDIDLDPAFVAGYCAGVSIDDFVPRMSPGPTRKVSRVASIRVHDRGARGRMASCNPIGSSWPAPTCPDSARKPSPSSAWASPWPHSSSPASPACAARSATSGKSCGSRSAPSGTRLAPSGRPCAPKHARAADHAHRGACGP